MTTLDDLIRQLREATEEEREAWRKYLMAYGDIVLPSKLYDALRPMPKAEKVGADITYGVARGMRSGSFFKMRAATVPLGHYHNHTAK